MLDLDEVSNMDVVFLTLGVVYCMYNDFNMHKIFNGKKEINEKDGTGNFVTNVDIEIEKYLKENLLKRFPNAKIIAEESSSINDNTDINLNVNEENKNNNEKEKEIKFIIDPLDGTTNFINSWSYTVSVGVVWGDELVGGIIFDVIRKAIYVGIKDWGVILCEASNSFKIYETKNPTYDKSDIKKAVISYDTPYSLDAFERTQKYVSALYHNGASLKTVGPISLDILKTALGKENRPYDYNHAVWHSEVRCWDVAAATCILRELGGEIIGINDGKPLSLETITNPTEKISFIASGNKELLEKIYELFNKA